ncbi:C2 domain containing protein [Trichomonas vaginalis G3]|uniref:C2 domain containing protein n=1 Tax=Trichomonas vaginalis (strain ATCC PRA-98 / G3) TaxID=412133 RepID=A2FCS8_TRIV3|nr:cAMP-binding protein 1-related family [Trichomonas vaginalis G3]EAX97302.1 C2 domain containing protein [Trichomonas vaginalis G3]KAI5518170.1 cAMP-binding protein 1-related family [Trichomonas vaginalis G3]|eukprot:XP_001310232.1 C2 domain containing protein [Trichomonas vaginalis G3]
MLKVYVISAKNLPAADSNGKSDPYVVIHSVDGNKFKFGQTTVQKLTCDPNWDPLLKNPFLCPFVRARSFLFEIYDKDTISKDDYLGMAQFDMEIHPIGQPVTLDVENVQLPTPRPPKIVVQVDSPTSFYPEGEISKNIHHLAITLTYDPPISFTSRYHPPELSMLAIHNDSKMMERIYGGMTPPHGILLDAMPQHVGPTGWTQVIRVNIKKAKGLTLIPLVTSKINKRTITVNYCGFQKEPKKDNVRLCDSKATNTGVLLYKSSVNANNEELLTLGSLVEFTEKGFEFKKFEGQPISESDYISFVKNVGIDPSTYAMRFNISLGETYSLLDAAKLHSIEFPKQIKFGLGWSGSKDLDSYGFIVSKDYKVIGYVSGASKSKFSYIKHMGDAASGSEDKDAESIVVNLTEVPDEVGTIAIFATYENGTFLQVQNIYMRVCTTIDKKEKELMYLPVVAKRRQNSLLFGILYRTPKGSWDLFPAAKLFEGKDSHDIGEYCNEFFEISGIVEDVINAEQPSK